MARGVPKPYGERYFVMRNDEMRHLCKSYVMSDYRNRNAFRAKKFHKNTIPALAILENI